MYMQLSIKTVFISEGIWAYLYMAVGLSLIFFSICAQYLQCSLLTYLPLWIYTITILKSQMVISLHGKINVNMSPLSYLLTVQKSCLCSGPECVVALTWDINLHNCKPVCENMAFPPLNEWRTDLKNAGLSAGRVMNSTYKDIHARCLGCVIHLCATTKWVEHSQTNKWNTVRQTHTRIQVFLFDWLELSMSCWLMSCQYD